VWIDLNCKDYPKPITYNGFRKIIERAIKRHNKKAEASGGKISLYISGGIPTRTGLLSSDMLSPFQKFDT